MCTYTLSATSPAHVQEIDITIIKKKVENDIFINSICAPTHRFSKMRNSSYQLINFNLKLVYTLEYSEAAIDDKCEVVCAYCNFFMVF